MTRFNDLLCRFFGHRLGGIRHYYYAPGFHLLPGQDHPLSEEELLENPRLDELLHPEYAVHLASLCGRCGMEYR